MERFFFTLFIACIENLQNGKFNLNYQQAVYAGIAMHAIIDRRFQIFLLKFRFMLKIWEKLLHPIKLGYKPYLRNLILRRAWKIYDKSHFPVPDTHNLYNKKLHSNFFTDFVIYESRGFFL